MPPGWHRPGLPPPECAPAGSTPHFHSAGRIPPGWTPPGHPPAGGWHPDGWAAPYPAAGRWRGPPFPVSKRQWPPWRWPHRPPPDSGQRPPVPFQWLPHSPSAPEAGCPPGLQCPAGGGSGRPSSQFLRCTDSPPCSAPDPAADPAAGGPLPAPGWPSARPRQRSPAGPDGPAASASGPSARSPACPAVPALRPDSPSSRPALWPGSARSRPRFPVPSGRSAGAAQRPHRRFRRRRGPPGWRSAGRSIRPAGPSPALCARRCSCSGAGFPPAGPPAAGPHRPAAGSRPAVWPAGPCPRRSPPAGPPGPPRSGGSPPAGRQCPPRCGRCRCSALQCGFRCPPVLR